MMVTEKQKSIAILRSFGMTQDCIMRIFIYSGMLISITSTFLGTVFGIIFSKNINSIKLFLEKLFNITLFDPMVYIFNEMPSKVISNDVLYIVLFTLFISFLAVIPPSRKAAKIDPAKILRYL
jgi:lipoprotein-releasing system permease protein